MSLTPLLRLPLAFRACRDLLTGSYEIVRGRLPRKVKAELDAGRPASKRRVR